MGFSNASFKVSRGFTYSYLHTKPSQAGKPYILFLHGFPSLPVDHHSQISYLSQLGYGILAPELLGYGDTSHPAETDSYRLKLMSNDLIEILDHHSIANLLAVGHDWGVTLLTRLEFYHPDRVTKMALLAVGAPPLGQPFDVDAVNSMMKERLGYEGFGYMAFLARDPDAADVLNSHQDSFRCLTFSADSGVWKDHVGAIGGMKKWVSDDRKIPKIAAYIDKIRDEHEREFSNDRGGYTGTLNWYKNHVFQKNTPDEKAELRARGLSTYQTQKPVLSILAAKDVIALPPVHQQMTEEYAPHTKTIVADAGHWVMLEAAETVDQALEEFFGS